MILISALYQFDWSMTPKYELYENETTLLMHLEWPAATKLEGQIRRLHSELVAINEIQSKLGSAK